MLGQILSVVVAMLMLLALAGSGETSRLSGEPTTEF
jgi:hypothetical protein